MAILICLPPVMFQKTYTPRPPYHCYLFYKLFPEKRAVGRQCPVATRGNLSEHNQRFVTENENFDTFVTKYTYQVHLLIKNPQRTKIFSLWKCDYKLQPVI